MLGKMYVTEHDQLYPYLSCSCPCSHERHLTRKGRTNSFRRIVTIFIFIISYIHTCLTDTSYDSPGSNWDTDSHSQSGGYTTCLGDFLEGQSLSGGTGAGRYSKLGTVDNILGCSNLCCADINCELAIMLLYPKHNTRTCFSIHCYDDFDTEGCKPVSSAGSKYHPHLFKRHLKRNDVRIGPEKNLDLEYHAPNKLDNRDAVCIPYRDSTCTDYLDISKLYYFSSNSVATLDKRLSRPIEQLRSRLSQKCFNLALQAICRRFYPQCIDPTKPEPIYICNDCDKLLYGDCASEFSVANMVSYLKHIISRCDDISEKHPLGCVETSSIRHLMRENNPPRLEQEMFMEKNKQTTKIPAQEIFMYERSSKDKENELDDTPTNSSLSNVSLESGVHLPLPTRSASNAELLPTSSKLGIASATSMPFVNTSHTKTGFPHSNFSTHTLAAIVTTTMHTTLKTPDVNATKHMNTTKHTNTTTKTTTTKIPVKKPDKHESESEVLDGIKVSAGDNTVLTLPTSSASLFASTWPKEEKEGDYTYKWSQVSAPKGSHGYIAGENTKNVKLSKLKVVGVYTFKLEVSTIDKKRHGIGLVNITVKKPARINHPPRAEITQKENVIQLPTNTVVLDASKSSDDDKIVSYKWEELEGPIEQKAVLGSKIDSNILQLRDLSVGVYKFQLTVTDSDGLTDKTVATVTVKKEADYPPKANAGSDIVIRLPKNTVVLNGNKSTDDKGVANLKFQWSKTADSPTCDMQGTDKSQLTLSRLQEGSYVFVLKVIDASQHSDEANVKVVVLPEKNSPPVAVAGDDKEIMYPDDSTTLDASRSTDNSKVVSFHWEQTGGPNKAMLTGADKVKVHLSDLVVGTYVLELTVTDDKGVTGTDTVKVHVKKDHNEHPVAVVGKDVIIHLPTRSVVLDGSKSHDDEIIVHYQWTRAGLSPAAGVVVNGSDEKAILQLTSLVKGRYMFDLTVTDNKGLTGTESVTVVVKENLNSYGLVELYLYMDIENFTEESKRQLVRKISVILEVEKNNVVIEELKGSTYGKGLMILFYVKDPNIERVFDGKYVADVLKQKIGFGGKLFEYTMQRVEPYICRNNCSDHGYCDKSTKECVCDSFWTANFLKSTFGEKESNCDWSVLYLSVAVFGLCVIFIGVAWSVCFCFARKKRNKRHARYHVLRSSDPDKDNILLVPNGMKERYSAGSLTFTESEDSADDATLFDKKKLPNGHVHKKKGNSSGNGYNRDYYLDDNF